MRATCEDTIWDSRQTGEQACLCKRSMGPWQLGDACKALNFPGKLCVGPLDRDAAKTNFLYAAFILQHIHFYKRVHREDDKALSKQGLRMYNPVGSFTWRMELLFRLVVLGGAAQQSTKFPRGGRESCETSHCQGPLRI